MTATLAEIKDSLIMMLSENQMTENDAVLLAQPTQGLGYQSAGAFQRLGKRILGFLSNPQEEALIKNIHMQHGSWDWQNNQESQNAENISQNFKNTVSTLMITPNRELALGIALSEAVIEKYLCLKKHIQRENPSLHSILIAPATTPLSRLEKFMSPQSTLFLSPILYSFRDQGILDAGLECLKKNPALLLSKKLSNETLEIAFAADIAGLLVCSPQKKEILGQCLRIPGTSISLSDFYKKFASAFEAKPHLSHKIQSYFSSTTIPKDFLYPSQKSTQHEIPHNIPLSSNFFPSPQSSIERALQKSYESYQRMPESGLHFQASRAL